MPQEIQRGLPAALAVGFNNDAGSIGCGRCCFWNESGKGCPAGPRTKKAAWIAPKRLWLLVAVFPAVICLLTVSIVNLNPCGSHHPTEPALEVWSNVGYGAPNRNPR